MNVKILHAEMTGSEQDGYLGHVHFEVEGHHQPYELTLQSERHLDDWNYAINFLHESGSEKEIETVERSIEEDQDFFDNLVEAAVQALED